jgi:hypothetical protein
MVEMYPQIGHKYEEDELEILTIASIGSLFRVHRLLGFTEHEIAEPSFAEYVGQLKRQNGMIVGPLKEPEQLWLIQQYYVHPNSKRASELKHCLEKNIENPLIDRIILLNEKKLTLPKSDKIQQVILGRRMRYRDVFEHILKIPTNIITVFSNSDIYLTDSFRNLWTLDIKDKFLSLLRYEENTNELFGPRPDSQDTWVVRSDSVQSRQWDMAALDFEFGKAGCDNAINVELLKKKFVVANPSLSLKTMHVHTSEVRDYNPLDPIDKPFYLYLDPTGLHDLEPKQDLDIYKKTWSNPISYSCR